MIIPTRFYIQFTNKFIFILFEHFDIAQKPENSKSNEKGSNGKSSTKDLQVLAHK